MTAPLYLRVMGDAWTQVAAPVRSLHATNPVAHWRGYLRIEHGRHRLTRFLARILRLPRSGEAVETRLMVTVRGDAEHWQRRFDGRRLETRQYESSESELAERFGVLEFRFRLDASDGSLLYVQRHAAFRFGPIRLPIPASWAPRVEAREDPAGPNRVNVDVRVALPRVGPLIAYHGIVEDSRA